MTTDHRYIKVRVTEDIGEVFGVDEEVYHLEAGQTIEIPVPNANPLFNNGVAFPVE